MFDDSFTSSQFFMLPSEPLLLAQATHMLDIIITTLDIPPMDQVPSLMHFAGDNMLLGHFAY